MDLVAKYAVVATFYALRDAALGPPVPAPERTGLVVATTRGAFMPDIDPKEHRLMIHGLVDRPLTFTMEDLKRLPSVTRLHFIECAGNRSSRAAKNVQQTHGMVSCAEWTGVLLSTLLKECGVKGSAKWFVAEGADEVMGASSLPIA